MKMVVARAETPKKCGTVATVGLKFLKKVVARGEIR